MKRKVDVTLLGHHFTVRTERDEAWVQRLAAYLGRRLEEARRSMRNASREEQVLFVALGLADELFEEAERSASARADIRRHTEAMIGKLSAALAGGESAAALNAISPGSSHSSSPLIVDVEDESDEVAVVHRQA